MHLAYNVFSWCFDGVIVYAIFIRRRFLRSRFFGLNSKVEGV